MHMSFYTMIHVSFISHNVTNYSLILSPYTGNLPVHLAGLYTAITASCRFLKPL